MFNSYPNMIFQSRISECEFKLPEIPAEEHVIEFKKFMDLRMGKWNILPESARVKYTERNKIKENVEIDNQRMRQRFEDCDKNKDGIL